MFENFGEKITQKLGPFPVWVWGVLIGGGLIAWYWFSGAGVTQGDATSSDGEFTTELAPSGDFSEKTVVPEGDSGVDDATNEEWLSQAISAAAGSGGSQVAIRAALQKFLMGEELTSQERGWVDRALTEVGQPPEGTSGISEGAPDEESAGPSTATTTVVKSTNKVRAGTPAMILAHVRWVNPDGRVNPSGVVHIAVDGKHWRTLPLTNGSAAIPFYMKRNRKGTRVVFTARYPGQSKGSESRRATGSAASPTVTTVQ